MSARLTDDEVERVRRGLWNAKVVEDMSKDLRNTRVVLRRLKNDRGCWCDAGKIEKYRSDGTWYWTDLHTPACLAAQAVLPEEG